MTIKKFSSHKAEMSAQELITCAKAFSLDDYIPYNILYTELLMYRSGRSELDSSLLDSQPLSQGEMRVLVFVYCGKARAPSDFIDSLGMDKALVTRNINSLRDKRLIDVSQDQQDKRRKVIKLTDAGSRCAIDYVNTLSQFSEYYDSAITKAEKKSLLRILAKLNAACRSL